MQNCYYHKKEKVENRKVNRKSSKNIFLPGSNIFLINDFLIVVQWIEKLSQYISIKTTTKKFINGFDK